jgi:heme ABC exporter ATP-binding subunit CcmA
VKAIEGRGLSQRFGSRTVFSGLDLEVEAGGSLAVLGDNGSGKTTLLRLIATAARPAGGELRLLGLDAVRDRLSLRRRIGWLGETPGLYPALTALENLELFADLHGVSRGRAREALAEVALEEAAGRRAGELSRGMLQRLALARALLHSPELLVLDEPEAGLDEAGKALLTRLAAGRTLVMASHDRALAARLCAQQLDLSARRLEVYSA